MADIEFIKVKSQEGYHAIRIEDIESISSVERRSESIDKSKTVIKLKSSIHLYFSTENIEEILNRISK